MGAILSALDLSAPDRELCKRCLQQYCFTYVTPKNLLWKVFHGCSLFTEATTANHYSMQTRTKVLNRSARLLLLLLCTIKLIYGITQQFLFIFFWYFNHFSNDYCPLIRSFFHYYSFLSLFIFESFEKLFYINFLYTMKMFFAFVSLLSIWSCHDTEQTKLDFLLFSCRFVLSSAIECVNNVFIIFITDQDLSKMCQYFGGGWIEIWSQSAGNFWYCIEF